MEIELKILDNNLRAKIRNTLGNSRGVYFLYSIDSISGDRKAVNRALGVDTKGILYIGGTDNKLISRVGSLKRGMQNGTEHPCGKKYNEESRRKFRVMFPLDSIYVNVVSCENGGEREVQEINKYISEFGELPPLNSNKPSYNIK